MNVARVHLVSPRSNFESAAIAAFRIQSSAIAAYAEYVRYLGIDPSQVDDWRDIPPVPTSAFKSHDLSAAPAGGEAAIFETSGTTISRPGRVRLASTDLYEASLLDGFESHLLPDEARLPAIVFGPNRAEAPRSSLWFMADRIVDKLTSGGGWVVRGGEPQWDVADKALPHGRPSPRHS